MDKIEKGAKKEEEDIAVAEHKKNMKPLIILSVIIVAAIAIVYAALMLPITPPIPTKNYTFPMSTFSMVPASCDELENSDYQKICSDFIDSCDDETYNNDFSAYCMAMAESDENYCDLLPVTNKDTAGREYCHINYHLTNFVKTSDPTYCHRMVEIVEDIIGTDIYRSFCDAVVSGDVLTCDKMMENVMRKDQALLTVVCKGLIEKDISRCNDLEFMKQRGGLIGEEELLTGPAALQDPHGIATCRDVFNRAFASIENDISYCDKIINIRRKENCEVEVSMDTGMCGKPVSSKTCYESYIILKAMESGDPGACAGFTSEKKKGACEYMVENSDVSGIEECATVLDGGEIGECVDSFRA